MFSFQYTKLRENNPGFLYRKHLGIFHNLCYLCQQNSFSFLTNTDRSTPPSWEPISKQKVGEQLLSVANPFSIYGRKKRLILNIGNSDTLICFTICFRGLLKEEALVAQTEGVNIKMTRNSKFIIAAICSAVEGRNENSPVSRCFCHIRFFPSLKHIMDN